MYEKYCPGCLSSIGLREIIYGMPDAPLAESPFAVGGCCISERDPGTICLNCGREGEFINNIEAMGLI